MLLKDLSMLSDLSLEGNRYVRAPNKAGRDE